MALVTLPLSYLGHGTQVTVSILTGRNERGAGVITWFVNFVNNCNKFWARVQLIEKFKKIPPSFFKKPEGLRAESTSYKPTLFTKDYQSW
jgi:hypothetical protein